MANQPLVDCNGGNMANQPLVDCNGGNVANKPLVAYNCENISAWLLYNYLFKVGSLPFIMVTSQQIWVSPEPDLLNERLCYWFTLTWEVCLRNCYHHSCSQSEQNIHTVS